MSMTTNPQLNPDEDLASVDDAQSGWEDIDAEAIAACVAAEEAGEDDDLDLEADSGAFPDSVRLYLNELDRHPLLTKAEEVRLAKLKDIYLPYKLSEDEARGLSAEQRDLAYWEKIKHLSLSEREQVNEGKRAFDQMVNSNLKLVVSVAKRYTGVTSKLDLLDLCQEGNVGLMRAVEKFDHRKGFKFSTYGSWWIRQSVTRAIGDHGRTIRLPVRTYELLRKMHAVKNRCLAEHGHEPTDDALAGLLEITVTELDELKHLPDDASSLNRHFGGDETADEIGELIEEEQVAPIDTLIGGQLNDALLAAINRLPRLQARVLTLRWGLSPEVGFSEEPRTLEDVGSLLGKPRERIRAAEMAALKTLQQDEILKQALDITEIRTMEDVLAERPAGRPHMPKTWTDEAIESALREFVGDRELLPSKTDFEREGKAQLYNQMVSVGSPAYWAGVLGVKPPIRKRPGVAPAKRAA
jgi:RNA polymerase primary sigma factor